MSKCRGMVSLQTQALEKPVATLQLEDIALERVLR